MTKYPKGVLSKENSSFLSVTRFLWKIQQQNIYYKRANSFKIYSFNLCI